MNRITGQTNSGELLAALDQARLFLEPLGGHEAWYRFHHPLCRGDAARRRASDWAPKYWARWRTRQACGQNNHLLADHRGSYGRPIFDAPPA